MTYLTPASETKSLALRINGSARRLLSKVEMFSTVATEKTLPLILAELREDVAELERVINAR